MWTIYVDLDIFQIQFSSVAQSCLTPVVSDSLQHARPSCLSATPRVYSNSCPLSRWCHLTILSSVVLSPIFNLSQHQDLSNESVLFIRWPKYWSFSFCISPSNEYSGLISFRMDWLALLEVQRTQESSTP